MIGRPFGRRRFLSSAGAAAVFSGPQAAAEPLRDTGPAPASPGRLAADPLRPQYHLLPPANYLGDPNGPIYVDGEYHLFHQYIDTPAGIGPRQWAHAVSSDMLHWRHLPLALSPTPGGPDQKGAMTGCTVMNGDTAVIFYTSASPETQCMATSRDGLRTWRKLPNPVIETPPLGLKATGFRDPVVWREGNVWKMTIGSGDDAVGPAVLLYQSDDLLNWTYVGPLYQPKVAPFATPIGVADGMMWECPDFFALDGKHVLLTSGRGTRYMIGSYDGRRFEPERSGLLDFGTSYAPRSMLDAHGNRILWAWILERRPQADIVDAGWSGAMSLPRQLNIGADGDLVTRPAPVIDSLRTGHRSATTEGLAQALAEWRIDDLCGELVVQARNSFSMQLLTSGGERYADFGYDVDHDQLGIGPYRPTLKPGANSLVTLRIFIDGSVIEAYANDRLCVTLRSYPKQPGPLTIAIAERDRAAIMRLDLWQLAPISADRLTT